MKKTTLVAVLLASYGIAYGAHNQGQQQQPNLAQQAGNNPLLADVPNDLNEEDIAAFLAQLEGFQQNHNNNEPQNPNNNQQLNVPFGANELGAAPMVDADNLNVGVINELPAPSPE